MSKKALRTTPQKAPSPPGNRPQQRPRRGSPVRRPSRRPMRRGVPRGMLSRPYGPPFVPVTPKTLSGLARLTPFARAHPATRYLFFIHDLYEKNTTDQPWSDPLIDYSQWEADLNCGSGGRVNTLSGFNGCGNFYVSDSSFSNTKFLKGTNVFWKWNFTGRSGEAGSRNDAATRWKLKPGVVSPRLPYWPATSPAVPPGVVPRVGIITNAPPVGVPLALVPYRPDGPGRETGYEQPGLGKKPKPGKDPRKRKTFAPGTSIFPGDDPVNNPSPSFPGKPAVPIQPHVSRPPPPRTKEKKVRVSQTMMRALHIANETLEFKDIVDAIYEALPANIQAQTPRNGRTRKGALAGVGRPYVLPQDKLAAIYRNMDTLDLVEALKNVAINQVVDDVVGSVMGGADRRANKSLGGARILGFT